MSGDSPSDDSVNARVAACALALLAMVAACDDSSAPEAEGPSRYCDILDPEVAEPVVGDLDVKTFGSEDLDPTRRQGHGLDCQVSTATGSDTLLTITLRDTTGPADWDAMKAQLAEETEGAPECTALTGDPAGYVCRGIDGTDETNLAALFPDRWIRIIARTRNGDAPPPDTQDVLAIAENIDANLEAYDADQ